MAIAKQRHATPPPLELPPVPPVDLPVPDALRPAFFLTRDMHIALSLGDYEGAERLADEVCAELVRIKAEAKLASAQGMRELIRRARAKTA